MSETIRKSHNVSVLMYHFVCPAKYRRVVIDEDVDRVIKETCEGIQERYEIRFLEVGTDKDHVHFLIQSVPTYSPNSEEHHSPGGVREMSTSEEKIVGRRILDRWLLRSNGE